MDSCPDGQGEYIILQRKPGIIDKSLVYILQIHEKIIVTYICTSSILNITNEIMNQLKPTKVVFTLERKHKQLLLMLLVKAE